MYRLRTARHFHDPMMLTGARISSCAAWQLLQVSRHVASRRAVAARRSAFSWTVMFAPGPIRVLRTTRAPCIAAFGNLEPARAALMQLRALVGSGEWRWQRQLERALSLLNLWGDAMRARV